MFLFFRKIQIPKTFPDSCYTNLTITTYSTITTTTLTTSTETTTTETVSETTKTTTDTTTTEQSTSTTTTPSFGSFGGPCNAIADCFSTSLNFLNGTTNVTVNTITCLNNICSCASPYSVYLHDVSLNTYFCKMPQDGLCFNDIECAYGTCNVPHKKCTGSGSAG
ncbi:unnamed protein product [Brachionus calyciflorus]|uniref:Uncharacterized protein n=1 Tax=Brachionus calyciflorus TaxID=104777 RepID=A0A813VCN2_9BILA|nr:unnamed protein product [Brachionus calyciflorus]